MRANRFSGFTLVEMLVVMAIIAVLAGLVLMGAGFAQRKAARSRTESEIKAMESALEAYKIDNGAYPGVGGEAAKIDARKQGNPNDYTKASKELYQALSGDVDMDGKVDTGGKQYMALKPDMIGAKDTNKKVTSNSYIKDPFEKSYGYSVIQSGTVSGAGYNPTFDLWSTGGKSTDPKPTDPANDVTPQWIRNW